jgi:hypothetical protein
LERIIWVDSSDNVGKFQSLSSLKSNYYGSLLRITKISIQTLRTPYALIHHYHGFVHAKWNRPNPLLGLSLPPPTGRNPKPKCVPSFSYRNHRPLTNPTSLHLLPHQPNPPQTPTPDKPLQPLSLSSPQPNPLPPPNLPPNLHRSPPHPVWPQHLLRPPHTPDISPLPPHQLSAHHLCRKHQKDKAVVRAGAAGRGREIQQGAGQRRVFRSR